MPLACCAALRPPKARRGALPAGAAGCLRTGRWGEVAEAAIIPTNATAATDKRFDDIGPAPPQGRDLDLLIADRSAQSSHPGTGRLAVRARRSKRRNGYKVSPVGGTPGAANG